jgi:beta-phosphoglucomutase-like phosphatase (HAD superfamily)
LAHVDTVIFDAEGVVVDTEKLWDLAQRDFLARRGLDYDRARIKPLLAGRASEEGMRELQRVLDLPGDPRELAAERLELLRSHLADVDYVPGFREFFAAIAPWFKTGLATAMEPELFELVDRRLELSELFRGHVYTLDNVAGRGKPAPDLFLHAASMLDSEPGSCVVIEDAPSGIAAARAAGMRCIGLATTFERELLAEADLVVESFAELDPARLDDLS